MDWLFLLECTLIVNEMYEGRDHQLTHNQNKFPLVQMLVNGSNHAVQETVNDT